MSYIKLLSSKVMYKPLESRTFFLLKPQHNYLKFSESVYILGYNSEFSGKVPQPELDHLPQCGFLKPTGKMKRIAIHVSPQEKLNLSPYLASVQLICKLHLYKQDLPAIVLTFCHYEKQTAFIERSIYYCFQWKPRSQNCSGAKYNLFLGFHFIKLR